MGLLPKDFYAMRIKDYELYAKGFNAKLKYEKSLLKLLALAIAASKTGKYPVKSAMQVFGEDSGELTIEEIRVAKARYKVNMKLKTGK